MSSPTSRLATLVATATLVLAGCTASIADPEVPSTTFVPPATTTSTAPPVAPSTTTTTTAPTTVTTVSPPVFACTIGLPPADLAEDGFYAKHCATLGISVVATAEVADGAITAAAERIHHLLRDRPTLQRAMEDAAMSVVVLAESEVITDHPVFANLYRDYPGTDWRRLGRSFPGTEEITVAAGAEENLLCLEDDRYQGEDMLVRALAQAIRRFGIAAAEPAMDGAIEQSYARAIATGLWQDTVAEVNSYQYWAEGAQSFFDANVAAVPTDGTHNEVATNDDLAGYDPGLSATLTAVFGEPDWRPGCP